jgi:hypothetical protein
VSSLVVLEGHSRTLRQPKGYRGRCGGEVAGQRPRHYAGRVADDSRHFGGEPRELAPAEQAFLQRLLVDHPPYLDVWLHTKADGTPWILISFDFVEAGAVRDTLRLDFDGGSIAGGWSPSSLNWDDGVRAEAANIPLDPPDGINLGGRTPAELADAARAWFDEHYSRWTRSARRPRRTL